MGAGPAAGPIFLVTGERIEDAMRQYLDRDVDADGF